MNFAHGIADSTRAAVGDIKKQGKTGRELGKAIQAADKTQKLADQARNDIEKARKMLEAQNQNNAKTVYGTWDAIVKARESADKAMASGFTPAGFMDKAAKTIVIEKIVFDHYTDVDNKTKQIGKAISVAKAAEENAWKVTKLAQTRK